MKDFLAILQDAVALAFVALGVAVAINWFKRRDRSTGFLALAIVLLATVIGVGRLQTHLHLTVPGLAQIELVAFAGTAYALLRYRDSLIPLPRRWHVVAIVSLAAASVLLLVAEALSIPNPALTAIAFAWVVIWLACIAEPILRFWLVARGLGAVQAWRLRSLSLGFGMLFLALVFAISVGLLVKSAVVLIAVELVVLAIVPLLYASFAPPSWLRRQWRASEEENVRAFMEELLLGDDSDAMSRRALELATRLVGGEAGALFDSTGKAIASRHLDDAEMRELADRMTSLDRGVGRIFLAGVDRAVIVMPVAGLSSSSTLVALAGPFTPDFGGDETARVQQLMSAFVTGLDRRHLITELEQTNAALKEANRHKSVFLANMSHELRTPLNAIIGFSELLTDARDGQFDDPTRRRFLNQILTSGKHLLGLINDILDLSKVEAGQMELRLQTVSVAEAVDQVARTVEPLLAKKSITLRTELGGSGDLLADPGKLKQMLLNLVSNAIKFTPDQGTVTISAVRTPKSIEIAVADTGVGVAESDMGQIFKEFHQIDQGPGRKHEGTGLGLALTKRFAVLHGGDVRVSSRVNEGSVFTLVLPVLPTAPRLVQATAAPAVNGHRDGPLILIVEDDPAAAELLNRQLTAAGYRTAVARTGKEALERAHQLQPAAITLDIMLPEIDGWEVINRLKSDEATSAIPILVVSVVDNPELGFALGAIEYFVKPVDGKLLLTRLEKAGLRSGPDSNQVKVLIVDDEPANRMWLAKALEPAGFTVLPAAGGREAIEIAKSQDPDFVVLDLMMPGVTGFDVVEALRADEKTRDTPIMVLTAANLSEADKRQLNGRVSQILSRGSMATADVVGLLKRVVKRRNGAH